MNTTNRNKPNKSVMLCMSALIAALMLAACGGGAENPAKVNLDGIWYGHATANDPETGEWIFGGSYSLTIAGNTYTRTADEMRIRGAWNGYFEQGTFKRTKTDWTFLPEIRGNYEDDTEPLSAESKKSYREQAPFSISGDILRIGSQEYQRAFTGNGAEYTGSMVRGKTKLDIVLTIGGFQDGEVLNSFYVYTRYNTPIKLEGKLTGTIMELAGMSGKSNDYFHFGQFDPAADTVVGKWYDEKRPYTVYEVTLTKKTE